MPELISTIQGRWVQFEVWGEATSAYCNGIITGFRGVSLKIFCEILFITCHKRSDLRIQKSALQSTILLFLCDSPYISQILNSHKSNQLVI